MGSKCLLVPREADPYTACGETADERVEGTDREGTARHQSPATSAAILTGQWRTRLREGSAARLDEEIGMWGGEQPTIPHFKM